MRREISSLVTLLQQMKLLIRKNSINWLQKHRNSMIWKHLKKISGTKIGLTAVACTQDFFQLLSKISSVSRTQFYCILIRHGQWFSHSLSVPKIDGGAGGGFVKAIFDTSGHFDRLMHFKHNFSAIRTMTSWYVDPPPPPRVWTFASKKLLPQRFTIYIEFEL